MKMPYPFNLFLIISAVGMISCSESTVEQGNDDPLPIKEGTLTISKSQLAAMGWEVKPLEYQVLAQPLRVNGFIDVPPGSRANIHTMFPGYVKRFHLIEGDYVKRGQIVAILENPDMIAIQEAYVRHKHEFEQAEDEYIRQQRLASENINSAKTLQQAKTSYISQKAAMEATTQKLKLMGISIRTIDSLEFQSQMAIYAPISGYVTRINTSLGAYVDAGTEMLELVDLDHLHIELNVFEKDLVSIHPNQSFVFWLPTSPEKTFQGHIYRIGKQVRQPEKVVLVHGHPEPESTELFVPGMYVEAAIQTDSISRLIVPRDAIKISADTGVLFVSTPLQNDSLRLQQRKVNIIGSSDAHYAILPIDSIKQGDLVLQEGIEFFLAD